jgi:hypothetical protein
MWNMMMIAGMWFEKDNAVIFDFEREELAASASYGLG